MFKGYSYINESRYNPTEYLDNLENVLIYIIENRSKYPKILITNSCDEIVIETRNGKVIFPEELKSKIDDIESGKAFIIKGENPDHTIILHNINNLIDKS